MMLADKQIRSPRPLDLDAAVRLLSEAGLPVDDATADHLALVTEENGELHGLIGLERFGDVGLLRSLVVASHYRGRGLGEALVSALEAQAQDCGVAELWLLTIDADVFFERLGYGVRRRDAAPDAIQATSEFSTLCPADAVLMSKSTSQFSINITLTEY